MPVYGLQEGYMEDTEMNENEKDGFHIVDTYEPEYALQIMDIEGEPLLYISRKGKFFWKGEEIDDTLGVYTRFSEWLKSIGF
jgi:hypothetical protein